MAQDIVILVHGVDSTGVWYEAAKAALSPHFDCKLIRYIEYERWGKLKVALDPILAILGIAVGSLAIAFLNGFLGILLGILSFFIICTANVRARYKRVKLAQGDFQKDVYTASADSAAHVIAHSFGTFLVGFAVRELHHLRFGRIIVAGCVLPRDFPWTEHHGHKFDSVWNDKGARDFIGLLVRIFGRLMPDLGDSGRRGFKVSASIHNVENPWSDCPACKQSRGIVHNVSHGFFHSTALTTRGHIEKFWLPFLWSIPPKECNDVLDWSSRLVRFTPDQKEEFETMGSEFCERLWTWTSSDHSGRTVISYLEALIAARLTKPCVDFRRSRPNQATKRLATRLAPIAVRRMWKLVADGKEARTSLNHPSGVGAIDLSELIKMTNPKHAAQAAAKWVVEWDRQKRGRN